MATFVLRDRVAETPWDASTTRASNMCPLCPATSPTKGHAVSGGPEPVGNLSWAGQLQTSHPDNFKAHTAQCLLLSDVLSLPVCRSVISPVELNNQAGFEIEEICNPEEPSRTVPDRAVDHRSRQASV